MKKLLKFENKTVEITYCEDNESPREWDNLGKCIFFHRNYDFGDKHNVNSNDYLSFDSMNVALHKDFDAAVTIPVYMYEHSGITIATKPFGCRWDSGQLGFIMATNEDIKKEFNVKRISPKLKEKVIDMLNGEISTLEKYVSGEIFSFTVIDNETGDEEDSCGGFYGDTADNGIYDHLGLDITFEEYKTVFDNASWGNEVRNYSEGYYK